MSGTAKLIIEGNSHDLPVVVGTEGDRAVDITGLREATGHITLDEGYVNTGSCRSAITFVDGERGHPPLSRHPDRAAGAQEHLRRDLLAAHLRGTAHGGTAQGLEQPVHQARDDPRRALPPLRRLPVHGPPDGHPLRHDQRHELLRTRI